MVVSLNSRLESNKEEEEEEAVSSPDPETPNTKHEV